MTGVLSNLLSRLGPFWAVFLCSLLLSVVAVWGKITPNNDGMLYVEAARLFQAGGLAAATQVYDWVFLSTLIGILANLSGLDTEFAAYLLCAVLLASLGVVLVGVTRELSPQATWAAVAVVLVLPALNNYRDFIIREHGSWLFTMLAIWLMIRWARNKRWSLAAASQLSLLLAALFRPESLAFLAIPFIWLVWQTRSLKDFRHLAQFVALPAIGAVALIGAMALTDLGVADKIARQLSAIDLPAQASKFELASERVGQQLSGYLKGRDAERVLFVGLLALIPIKFVTNLGVLIVPMLRSGVWRTRRLDWFAATPLVWAFALYAFSLAALVLDIFFMQARFIVLLNIFAVPVLAFALYWLWQDWPRARWAIATVAVLAALANVISTSPKHLRYVAAADWLTTQQIDPKRVYFDEPAIGYLVGVGLSNNASPAFRGSRVVLEKAIAEDEFELYVLTGKSRDEELIGWGQAHGLMLLAEFSDERRERVYVFGKNFVD